MDAPGSAPRTARTTSRTRRMRFARGLLAAALASLVSTATAFAGDATILGRALVVTSTPDAAESARTVTMTARESSTDLGALTDPRLGGATLTVVVAGATPSTQSFVLDASRWSAVPNGYRYRMAKNDSGPPVRRVVVTAVPGGAATMRVVLRGDTGTDPLLIVPPDPGTEGGVALAIGGDRYCARVGGPVGGTTGSDTATRWRIVRPLSEQGCLDAPPPLCGNGTIEGDETCDGSGPPVCDITVFSTDAICGAADSVHPCSCCYPSGTEYTAVSGADGFCCDGLEFPVAPYSRYCGSCLPDGYHCLFGPTSCCSGTCHTPDDLPVPVCGSGS